MGTKIVNKMFVNKLAFPNICIPEIETNYFLTSFGTDGKLKASFD